MPSGGPRPNCGGAQPGAGRKSLLSKVSAKTIGEFIRALKTQAKECGYSWVELVAERLMDRSLSPSEHAKYVKIAMGLLTVSESHKTVEEHKHLYRPLILPERLPIPKRETSEEVKH